MGSWAAAVKQGSGCCGGRGLESTGGAFLFLFSFRVHFWLRLSVYIICLAHSKVSVEVHGRRPGAGDALPLEWCRR